ncbi:MAG: IS5/IS1182 family transposase [Firmicutes bacterium HGW-Firmicutes-8]|nr:MAG: IS5/IS1182 family transposase [Firmicutes bacterium HGW-Firmicutes-8]
MYSIRQERLFSLEQLLEMSPREGYELIFQDLDITPFLHANSKNNHFGAPVSLNYMAMIYSLFIRVVERIPTIKDLVRRLKRSIEFRDDCGFTGADQIPSEAAYSRMIKKIQTANILQSTHHQLIAQAFQEGFIDATVVAIDATHIEARDRQPEKKTENSEALPTELPKKKRGRKSKAEREQWLKEQEELEAARSLFEKKVEQQLPYSFDELDKEIPLDPEWGVKKNSEGKNVFWYGFKGHLLVDCQSQHILTALFSSAHINDGKMAIPLLKSLAEHHPYLLVKHVLGDAGYDLGPIYKQAELLGARALIDYNRRNEQPVEGKDKYFRPVCQQSHPYLYDSFDPKYETLKYTQPKECKQCPLNHGQCQKVFKIKISTDLRKYTVPARGSDSYKDLYKQRTAVERVNAYLKEFFQLNNIRHRTGHLAKVDFQISCLTYTLCKLAVDRVNRYQKTFKEVA